MCCWCTHLSVRSRQRSNHRGTELLDAQYDPARAFEVDRGEVRVGLLFRPTEEIDDHSPAEADSSHDPAFVLCVQRANEVSVLPVGWQESGLVAVSTVGEPAEIVVEQMQRNVLHAPVPRLGGSEPLVVGETVEKCDQLLAFDGDRWANVLGRQVGELHQGIVSQYVTQGRRHWTRASWAPAPELREGLTVRRRAFADDLLGGPPPLAQCGTFRAVVSRRYGAAFWDGRG